MPKAWTGLSSTTAADYEALEARQFLDPYYGATPVQVTDEAITVKDTLCAGLHFIPRGNLTNATYLAIRTAAAGGGTLLTCTTTTGALTTGQVRVRHRTGKLEFHADQENTTLYATYTTRVSNVDAALIAQMYHRIRSIEAQAGIAAESYNAGEDVVAGPGYISAGLLYQADPSDLNKCGWVWILADATTGNPATIYRTGQVTPRRTMPANTPIYAGHGGDVTWEGDAQASAKLDAANDYYHCIGYSDDGITLNLLTAQDARRQT